MTQLRTLELFCGAGGMARGLGDTGYYRHVLGVDFNANAVATYRENIGDAQCADLKSLTTLRMIAGEYAGEIDVLAGGPPCQPFSEAGRKRGQRDERNGWPVFLLALRKLRPRAFIAENVARLTHEPCRPYLNSLLDSMRRLGYTVAYRVLDAADYGVPQHRKRVFIVGFLDRWAAARFQWPLPTHSPTGDMWTAPHIGAGVALRPRLARRVADPNGLPNWLRCAEERNGSALVRGVTGGWAKVNIAAGHARLWAAHDLVKFQAAKIYNGAPGGDRVSRQTAALFDGKGHRRYQAQRSYGAQGQNWQALDLPSFTITAASGTRHRVQVGDDVWKLDVGDLAALQSFPDDYRWIGNTTSVSAQIGNAVPPLLARAIGETVAQAMGATQNEAAS